MLLYFASNSTTLDSVAGKQACIHVIKEGMFRVYILTCRRIRKGKVGKKWIRWYWCTFLCGTPHILCSPAYHYSDLWSTECS